jgi:hypothetical protein
MMRFSVRGTLVLVAAALLIFSPGIVSLMAAFQDAAIRIQTDPIAVLQERLDRGEVRLERSGSRGYLDTVLEALRVPASSQTFVFSKTSLQSDLIDPDEPRALYFNDEVYVGFVKRGPVLEFGAIDPVHGTVFYTLSQEPTETPTFELEGIRCISCHLPSRPDIPVPRLMVMSVMPNEKGEAVGTDVSLITEASPLVRRWGGWYVTGTGGEIVHRGNSVIGGSRGPDWVQGEEPHLRELSGRFDVEPYLRNDSDIVALLLLVHQSQVHNLMGDAAFAVRAAIAEEERRERFLSTPDPAWSPQTIRRVREMTEPLVRALLFADAVALEGSVGAPSEFAAEFQALGPRDSQGRSLRDLDLGDRLLRYPLSYLVYSAQFDALPDLAREYVFGRLGEVLAGEDTSEAFEHLTPADRGSIFEILRATKPEFAAMAEGAGF